MNANALADEVVSINDAIESEYNRFKELDQAATMLRQQQAEIEALKAKAEQSYDEGFKRGVQQMVLNGQARGC